MVIYITKSDLISIFFISDTVSPHCHVARAKSSNVFKPIIRRFDLVTSSGHPSPTAAPSREQKIEVQEERCGKPLHPRPEVCKMSYID